MLMQAVWIAKEFEGGRHVNLGVCRMAMITVVLIATATSAAAESSMPPRQSLPLEPPGPSSDAPPPEGGPAFSSPPRAYELDRQSGEQGAAPSEPPGCRYRPNKLELIV